jgi:hypothetical protein
LIRWRNFGCAGSKGVRRPLYNAYERINTRNCIGGHLSEQRATALFVVIATG